MATLPVLATTSSAKPIDFIVEIARAACRSLNEPVGPCRSSLRYRCFRPSMAARFSDLMSGVPPSPMLTINRSSWMGSSSR